MLRLCIPVHNEAPTIGVLLWRIRKVFQEFSREYDVTVFDDASDDGTAELLDPYRAVMPLTVLSAPKRVGYAAAVDALVRHVAADDEYARRDAMILLQGDFTDQPEQLPELIRRFEGGADVVAVARALDDAMPADERRLRRWGGWAVRPFVKVPAFGDPFGGYRLVRIAVLRDLLRAAGARPVLAGDDPWAANADFALTVTPFARRIENVELPGRWDVRPRPSHHRAWPDTLMLFRWARAARRLERPQPKPGPAGRGGEVPRPAGVEYVRTTTPPPPRPPRPTQAELAASEAPSRRSRRPAADRTEFAGGPIATAAAPVAATAAAPEPPPRAERGERPERTDRADRTERPARPPRGDRPSRDGATGRAERADRAERESGADREKGGDREAGTAREKRAARPRADRPPREDRRPAAEGEGDAHRHLRKVAQHPYTPGEPLPAAAAAEPPVAALTGDAAPAVPPDAAALDLAAPAPDGVAGETIGDAPAKKKRRRRRKRRSAGQLGDGASSGDDAAGDDTGDDTGDDGGEDTGGGDRDEASTMPDATARATDDDARAETDASDASETGDAPSGERRKRRPRRRRRRPRPSEGGDGVVGSGDADASSQAAPAPPPSADGD